MNIKNIHNSKGGYKMDEENFEKKSSKKTLKIVLLILLILAIAGAVTFFALNKVNSKPDKVFEKAVDQMFEETEKVQEYKTASMELDISGEVKATETNTSSGISTVATQINMINTILKDAKLHTEVQVDLENKLLDLVLAAQYQNKDVISVEGLIQDGKVYAYLKDLYSKYIEIPSSELEGIDVSAIFETSKGNANLTKDIKEILKSKIEDSEFETEKAEIEIDGKTKKVNKSTMKLSMKELGDICYDILDKVKEQQDSEVKEMITEMQEELKNPGETENYMNIDIYSEKTGNKIVKVDVSLVNEDDDEVILISGTKTEDKTWEIVFSINEDSTDTKDVKDMMKMVITEENENEGKISFTVIVEEEGIEATVNIKYKVEYNKDIEKKNVRNSINANSMTEADFMEIYQNAQKNEILKSIIDYVSATSGIVNQVPNPSYNNLYNY